MELNVRLSAKDLQTDGVFKALERLCMCFKPEESKCVNLHPPKQAAEQDAGRVPQGNAAVNDSPAAVTPAIPATTPAPAASTGQSAAAFPPVIPIAQQQQFDPAQVAQAAAIFAETSEQSRAQVVDLIHSFGVNALGDIPPEQLGAFATQLRGLGARI